jgi:hypothetical protein
VTRVPIVGVAHARAKLNELIDRDCFAISRRGKIVGVYLSRSRIEALVETMELLADPKFVKTLKAYESGRMKFYEVDELENAMSG